MDHLIFCYWFNFRLVPNGMTNILCKNIWLKVQNNLLNGSNWLCKISSVLLSAEFGICRMQTVTNQMCWCIVRSAQSNPQQCLGYGECWLWPTKCVSKVSSVLLSAVFGICVFVTSDNGSIWLLVQFLAGPEVEPLTGLYCTNRLWQPRPLFDTLLSIQNY